DAPGRPGDPNPLVRVFPPGFPQREPVAMAHPGRAPFPLQAGAAANALARPAAARRPEPPQPRAESGGPSFGHGGGPSAVRGKTRRGGTSQLLCLLVSLSPCLLVSSPACAFDLGI